ncbi:MAG TPA: DUF4159 domain-containing protein [bacterium]|nr:DUF4159 domain-containing protein [bacterium]
MRRTAVVFTIIFLLTVCGAGHAAKRDEKPGADRFVIAQIHYGGGGDWYEDKTSLIRLQKRIHDEFGLEFGTERKTIRIMDESLFSYPMIYITGHGNIVFEPEEIPRLRDYIDRGGFIWASDDYGMDEAFRREMARVLPDAELLELPFDHEIYAEPYAFNRGLPKIHEHAGGAPHGYGIYYRERMVAFYDFNTDIGDGLEAPSIHKDPADVRESAFKMAVNIVFYALTH